MHNQILLWGDDFLFFFHFLKLKKLKNMWIFVKKMALFFEISKIKNLQHFYNWFQ
jgi:hypothetical protein